VVEKWADPYEGLVEEAERGRGVADEEEMAEKLERVEKLQVPVEWSMRGHMGPGGVKALFSLADDIVLMEVLCHCAYSYMYPCPQ